MCYRNCKFVEVIFKSKSQLVSCCCAASLRLEEVLALELFSVARAEALEDPAAFAFLDSGASLSCVATTGMSPALTVKVASLEVSRTGLVDSGNMLPDIDTPACIVSGGAKRCCIPLPP